MMNRNTAHYYVFQLLSLLVTGFVLLSIFVVYVGLVGRTYVPLAVLALFSAVALRYVVVYHRFARPAYRFLAAVPLALALVASGLVALARLHSAVSLADLKRVFFRDTLRFGTAEFLPGWWIAALLLPAGALIVVGWLVTRDPGRYPKPTAIREIATSPAYFGAVCIVFGLWAVLFVGISIQRIVVVAPLFEELLKFGVALLIGGILFDRSVAARIGVALVVGALFGLIEHATTYPTEADTVYLFRTLFHASTTVLSVSTYTVFESHGEDRLRWIAPAYPVALHFFYNTFAVVSALLTVAVFGSHYSILSLVYGAGALVVSAGLLLLGLVSHRGIVALHRPLEHVLSDLV